jgi:hypothetical protein
MKDKQPDPKSLSILIAQLQSLSDGLDEETAKELLSSVNYHLSLLTSLHPIDPKVAFQGCENAGNTCYLDSILYCLFASSHQAFDACLVVPNLSIVHIHLLRMGNRIRMGLLIPSLWIEDLRALLIECGFQGGMNFDREKLSGLSRFFRSNQNKILGYAKNQQDASELFLFLADLLSFPKLVFYEQLIHGAEVSVDDTKVTTQRVLEISMDANSKSLADLLRTHFFENEGIA